MDLHDVAVGGDGMSAVSTARSSCAPKRSATTRNVWVICMTGRFARDVEKLGFLGRGGVRMSSRSSIWFTWCPMAEKRSTMPLSALQTLVR